MLTKEEIQYYEDLAAGNLDYIFKHFQINLNKYADNYQGCCPIHDGANNPNGFCLYFNRERIKWRCFTHQCHSIHKDTTLGLIRGLLSQQSGRTESFGKVIEFCKTELNGKVFIREKYSKEPPTIIPSYKLHVPREIVRSRLKLPSNYFLKRNFSREILDLHDVGESISYNKKTCWRAIVPIYDETNSFCIGCTARSVFNKCVACDCYHDITWKCPKDYIKRFYCKWKNVSCHTESSLYNYWFLGPEEPSVIVVESPGNVWRIKEAGFNNVIGLYGCRKLNSYQINLLKQKNVRHLYFGLDNDNAGQIAFQENGKHLWKLFNIHKLNFPPEYNDFGEMSHKLVRDTLSQQLRG